MADRRRRPKKQSRPADAESLAERRLELTGEALPEPETPVVVTTLVAEECEPPDEAFLRGLMKDWRKGRATKSLGQLLSDAYIAVFAVLMIGAMAANVVVQAQASAASCSTTGCSSARLLLPWALVALVAALTLTAARLFGPVLASPAEGAWLMSAPISRGRLLRSRLLAAVLLGLLVGGVLAMLVALLVGTAGPEVAAWSVATGLLSAALIAWAATEQTAGRLRPTRILSAILGLAGVAVLLLVVAIAAGWTSFTLPGSTRLEVAVGIAAISLLLGLVLVVVAARGLDRIHRVRLTSGGGLARGLSGAFFALDLGLIHDIVVERRAAEKGRVRATRGSGTGTSALVVRELQRALRNPSAFVLVLASAVVPYAADALGAGVLAPFLGAWVLFLTLIPLCGGLRVLTRTAGLARAFPFSNGQLRVAAATVPAAAAFVWALITATAFLGFGSSTPRSLIGAAMVALVTAAAGLMGAIRWTTAKNVNWSAPMASTPAGAVPPGLMLAPIRGLDMVLLITAPVMLNLSPLWSVVILVIVAVILLGGFDADQARARQEEQQKELARVRSSRKR